MTAEVCKPPMESHINEIRIVMEWHVSGFIWQGQNNYQAACMKFYDVLKSLYSETDASGIGLMTGP